jgi:hypothetical protein
MAIVLQSTGGGSVSIQEPTTASNFTQTLPASTGTVMVSGNMPAFSAYRSGSGQSLSSGWNKIQCQTKEFDTANYYDNSTNYRYTPLIAGYYQFSSSLGTNGTSGELLVSLYKNGTEWKRGSDTNSAVYGATVSALIYMNGSTDYVEMYGYINAGSPSASPAQAQTWFQAVMVRSA